MGRWRTVVHRAGVAVCHRADASTRIPLMPHARAAVSFAATTLVVAVCAAIAAPASGQMRYTSDPRALPAPPPHRVENLGERWLPGWAPHTLPTTLPIPDEGDIGLEIAVEAGVCYGFGAWSGDVADLDIRVRRGNEVLAQNVSNDDSYPIASFCARADGRVRVELSAHTTGGTATWMSWVDRNSLDAAGERDEIGDRLDAAAARTAPRWYPVGAQWRERFNGPGERTFALDAPAGACYVVVAVGASSIHDLDLRLRGPDRVLDEDHALDAIPAVMTCLDQGTPLEVDVLVVEGDGLVGARVLRTTP